jgi:hypothetical protein
MRLVPAIGADISAHVLDDSQNRHVGLLEHRYGFARIDQRQILWRRDDHRASERNALGYR